MFAAMDGAGGDAAITGDDRATSRARKLHLLRAESAAIPAGILCLILGVAGVWWLFAGQVDAQLLGPWLVYMAAMILALLAAHIASWLRKPPVDEYLGFWGPLGRALNFALVVGTVASVWILMPAADQARQGFLIAVYTWFVVVQMMVHAEGARLLTTTAIAGVLGSLVIYKLANPTPFSLEVAAVLALMAATMVALQDVFRRAVRDAIDARILSESLTQARDRALATVIVERDLKTRFLESASHDLRQPLQAARMFLDQFQRSAEGTQREKALDSVHWALDATDRSLTQILEHLRLDAGEMKAEGRVFDIGPLLKHMATFNEPHCQAARAVITVMPSHIEVFADPLLVERALGNFIGNALRHSKARRILVGARRSRGAVRIWVIDDGVGTAAGDRAALFDDYVQGSDHGDTRRGGFGLGLATVRRLAALMNGSAGLDPRWTNGSAFWLELPARSG